MSRLVSQYCDGVSSRKCGNIFEVLARQNVSAYMQDSIDKEVSDLPIMALHEQSAVVSTATFLHKLKVVLTELVGEKHASLAESIPRVVSDLILSERRRLSPDSVDETNEKQLVDHVEKHLHEKTGTFIARRERSLMYHLIYDYFLAFISTGCDTKNPPPSCPNVIMDFKISLIAFSLCWHEGEYPFVHHKPRRSHDKLVDKANIEHEAELFMAELVSVRKIFQTDLEIKLLSNFLSISAIVWQKYLGVTKGYAPFHPALSTNTQRRSV